MVSGHLAGVRIEELDAGPTGDYRVADNLHLMATVMLKAEVVLALDALLDGPGQRVISIDVKIVVKRTPQVHLRVRSPETSVEAEQIHGNRVVGRRVVRSPKLVPVVRRNDIQLTSSRERDHIFVDDQRRGKLGRQDDRRLLCSRAVRV